MRFSRTESVPLRIRHFRAYDKKSNRLMTAIYIQIRVPRNRSRHIAICLARERKSATFC